MGKPERNGKQRLFGQNWTEHIRISQKLLLILAKKNRVPVYIYATQQSTTAIWTLEGIEVGSDAWVAVLSEIPDLKPFPLFSKVRVKGREIECYFAKDRLIQRDSNTLEFWLHR